MVSAEDLAKKQRDIGVAEFFAKNRHLLGFDNKRKALMTAVKEAVDNSLDACEEARILPEIIVELVDMGNERFRVIVEDNGPGIIKKQIPKIFAKLLYGSKFFSLKQSRGQQGLGISAAVMYGQLTTGRAAKITSKTDSDKPASYFELKLDTQTNNPEIILEKEVDWNKDHGTRVEIDLEGNYIKGSQSIDEYLKETAIANPHVTIIYTTPKAEQFVFARIIEELPPESKAIKPHPYGVELGILMKMLSNTEFRTLQAFLTNEFSRVGPGTAKEICENAAVLPDSKPQELSLHQVESLIAGIKKTKIISPPTDCISPIGSEQLEKGLRKEIRAEYYCSVSRPPEVYRGNPFAIEVSIAYGGDLPSDQPITLLRYANRVPLLYQQGACAINKAVVQTNWRPYGLNQPSGALPVGPMALVVHISSIWVPYTSESKEAIAHYPEIIKEIKLALQDCGRQLARYVNKKKRINQKLERANMFEVFIPEVADSVSKLSGVPKEKLIEELRKMTKKEEIQTEIEDMGPDEEDGTDKSYNLDLKKNEESDE